MSLICKMSDECLNTKGMCRHEKMMLGAVIFIALGAFLTIVFKLI